MKPTAQPRMPAFPEGVALGDPRPLLQQLGATCPHLLLGLSAEVVVPAAIVDAASLRAFLRDYRCHLLVPHEWPQIVAAFELASRGQVRELVALDAGFAPANPWPGLAAASRKTGRAQLERLRPLRDQRTVQRFLQAVERGAAPAWSPTVYGLVLSLYAVPIRQGLLFYAHQTLSGWVRACTPRLGLNAETCEGMDPETCAGLFAALESLLHRGSAAGLRIA